MMKIEFMCTQEQRNLARFREISGAVGNHMYMHMSTEVKGNVFGGWQQVNIFRLRKNIYWTKD